MVGRVNLREKGIDFQGIFKSSRIKYNNRVRKEPFEK